MRFPATLTALALLALASCGAGGPVYAHEWFSGTVNPIRKPEARTLLASFR